MLALLMQGIKAEKGLVDSKALICTPVSHDAQLAISVMTQVSGFVGFQRLCFLQIKLLNDKRG